MDAKEKVLTILKKKGPTTALDIYQDLNYKLTLANVYAILEELNEEGKVNNSGDIWVFVRR